MELASNVSNHNIVIEVHPSNGTTINSVSYNLSGSWTSCTRNDTDWLLWTCGYDSVSGNRTVRVVSNVFPGTSENISVVNYTFKNVPNQISFCANPHGPGECQINSPYSMSGNYLFNNFTSTTTLSITGNTTIVFLDYMRITNTGGISIASGATLTLRGRAFYNEGNIVGSGSDGSNAYGVYNGCDCGSGYGPYQCCYMAGKTPGTSGANITLDVSNFTNSGTIILNGGKGGDGGAFACTCNAPTTPGDVGGSGGTITFTPRVTKFNNSGAITANGGLGGNGGQYYNIYWRYWGAGNGGNGGNLTANDTNFTNTGTININGGDPGTGGLGGGVGGTGGNGIFNISQNITVTNTMSAAAGSGGVAGIWNITYCGNGSAMDWTKITPTPTKTIRSCLAPPSFTISSPAAGSTSRAFDNLTVNTSAMSTELQYTFELSQNNGSNWEYISPLTYTFPPSLNNTGLLISLFRRESSSANISQIRAYAYNSTSRMYSEPVIQTFSILGNQTNLTAVSIPNGSVTTSSILFICNYTNTTGAPIEAATIKVNLTGTLYDTAYDPVSKTYNFTNTATLAAGNYSWTCMASKANYAPNTSTPQTFTMAGFGKYIVGNRPYIDITCPFPTVYGITPSGQRAAIGVLRIQNLNSSTLNNYSIILNQPAPSGVYIYARSDRFVGGTNISDYVLLNSTDYARMFTNLNASNTSAYIWMKANCIGASVGVTEPFDFVVKEN